MGFLILFPDLNVEYYRLYSYNPPLHILKFLNQNNLKGKNQSEKILGVNIGSPNSHGTPSKLCLNHQILELCTFSPSSWLIIITIGVDFLHKGNLRRPLGAHRSSF